MRRSKSVLLGDVLKSVIRDAGLEDGLTAVKIGQAYDRAVGQSIVSCTLRKDFENGVLTCRIGSSMVRTHLEFDKEALRGIINEIMGEDIVTSIRFL